MMLSLCGCPAPPHWEQRFEVIPPAVVLDDSAKEAAFDLDLALEPVVEGRDGKAGTLYLHLELEGVAYGLGGTRPLTSVLIFADDPQEPVPQMANFVPDDEGLTLYRQGADVACEARERRCEVGYTVLFEQLGTGGVQIDWTATAVATGGQQAIELMSPETVVEMIVTETSL